MNYPLTGYHHITACSGGAQEDVNFFTQVVGLRMAKHHRFFVSDKAERELGFAARPYTEGLRDAVDWFRGAGYLQ